MVAAAAAAAAILLAEQAAAAGMMQTQARRAPGWVELSPMAESELVFVAATAVSDAAAEAARTVDAGKPSFTLTLDEEVQ